MLALPKTITHQQAANSADWQANARANLWQIDCSALVQFDSAALALLLDLRRSAQADQQSLTIAHPPAQLQQLAHLYGVSALLGFER